MTTENTATEHKEVEFDNTAFLKHMHEAMADFLYGPGAEKGSQILINYQDLVSGLYEWAGAELAVILSLCNGREGISVIMNAEASAQAGIKAAVDTAVHEKMRKMMGLGDDDNLPDDLSSMLGEIFKGMGADAVKVTKVDPK